MKPHVCPVCHGNGIVPQGFYGQTSGCWISNGTFEKCRSCGGTGIVWCYEQKCQDEEVILRKRKIPKVPKNELMKIKYW